MEGVYLGVVSPRQDWGRRHRLQAHMSALMEYIPLRGRHLLIV
jgi:hypothetical protein